LIVKKIILKAFFKQWFLTFFHNISCGFRFQEQLHAIQQSMIGGSVSGKNKNKPVSTVEPFQRQNPSGAVPKVKSFP